MCSSCTFWHILEDITTFIRLLWGFVVLFLRVFANVQAFLKIFYVQYVSGFFSPKEDFTERLQRVSSKFSRRLKVSLKQVSEIFLRFTRGFWEFEEGCKICKLWRRLAGGVLEVCITNARHHKSCRQINIGVLYKGRIFWSEYSPAWDNV